MRSTVVILVLPRIALCGLWMINQVEYFDNAVPYRLPLKRLFDYHASHVSRFNTVELPYRIRQVFNLTHEARSTSSDRKALASPV